MSKLTKWSLTAALAGFLFAFMMVLQLMFTHFIMPETKGVSLEDLSKKLIRN